MEVFFTSESLISFFILVVLEVVLGIDNVIFVSIILNRLPKKDQQKARRFWMITGIIMRSLLLLGLGQQPLHNGNHYKYQQKSQQRPYQQTKFGSQ